MGTPSAGEVVLLPFPFSDLSLSKMRPAVSLADAGHGDWVLCQVTSNPYGDAHAVALAKADVRGGKLRIASYARPGKLFTAHRTLIAGSVGALKGEAFHRVINAVLNLLRQAQNP